MGRPARPGISPAKSGEAELNALRLPEAPQCPSGGGAFFRSVTDQDNGICRVNLKRPIHADALANALMHQREQALPAESRKQVSKPVWR